MTSGPAEVDGFTLSGLAEVCSKSKALPNLLQIYDAMTTTRHQVRPGFDLARPRDLHYQMEEVWAKALEPHLPEIVHPLLERTTWRIEERHALLKAWGQITDARDPDSRNRSAIEPHAQDEMPWTIDGLIDVARKCLEWLANHEPEEEKTWSERFVASEVALLRRLAIHAIGARTDLSRDEKIAWLVEKCDVNEVHAHHEIFRAVAEAYPEAAQSTRSALIQAVSEYRAPESEYRNSVERTAYHHFVWFHWLHAADPKCDAAKEALDVVWAAHPDFPAPEHADFTHWMEIRSPTSPWTAEMLLEAAPDEVLHALINHQPNDKERFWGDDRWALRRAVGEASKRDPSWALGIADAMASIAAWEADLWPEILTSWQQTGHESDQVMQILQHLSAEELQQRHPSQIADILSDIVQQADPSSIEDPLPKCNDIASALERFVPTTELPNMAASAAGEPQRTNWLNLAINHLSGKLALYRIHSISRWMKQQEETPKGLDDEYKVALQRILDDATIAGKLGRSVLASQLSFMLYIDQSWAEAELLPLFKADQQDFQFAWDGFLGWGRLSRPIAELLKDHLISATGPIQELSDRDTMMRFTQFYVTSMGWLISSAEDRWITEFFRHASAEAKRYFAADVGRSVRGLSEAQQQEWWRVWIRDYWSNRLQGIPAALDDEEVGLMLDWVLQLPGVFHEAVTMALQTPKVSLGGRLILHDIAETELAEQHPIELAQFLIHLSECETEPWFWWRTKATLGELLESPLPDELERRLREIGARHNLGE